MKRIVGCIIFALLAGCVLRFESQAVPEVSAQSPFADRLANAGQIVDFTVRDRAYAKIAEDAATANDGAAALQATTSVTSFVARDRVAADCATILDSQGNRSAAEAEVDQITSFRARDKARAELAMNPPGHPKVASPSTMPVPATPTTLPASTPAP
jgi:hypothetical protein